VGVADGEAVDDAGTLEAGEPLGQPRHPRRRVGQVEHRQVEAPPVERPARHEEVVTELVDDVGDDPVVGGRRRAQHGDAGRQTAEHLLDPPVVGAEVVAPVADAMGLVDHEEPDRADERWQDVAPEPRVVQPLRGDEQDVGPTVPDPGLDPLPLVSVGAVDGLGVHAETGGGLDLVPHQRQQGGDQHRGTGTPVAQQSGGDEVHRALAPAGPLDDEGPAALGDQRVDRLPLAGAEGGVGTGREAAEQLLGLVPQGHPAGCSSRG
jgi:hypothetical protein